MSKFSLILAVLLLAAPAWARVDIECSRIGESDDVLVKYRVTGDEPNKVRAFALDITVDKGVITDVNDYVSDDYCIYPGSIDINDTTGNVDDWGTAVADPNYPGTGPGLDSNWVTVEMGGLWHKPVDSDSNAPPAKGLWVDLLKLTISDTTACITITENGARGGVVLTNPTIDPDVNSPGCCVALPIPPPPPSITYTTSDADGKYPVSWEESVGTTYQLESITTISPSIPNGWVKVYDGPAISYNEKVGGGTWTYRVRACNIDSACSEWTTGGNSCVVSECLIGGNAGTSELSDWRKWRYPACSCYKRQCRGDIDGKRIMMRWVQGADLTIFRNAFLKSDAQLAAIPNGICADLDHKKIMMKRVQGADLTILRTYFLKSDAAVPICDQDPIITGPYNYWTN